MAAPMGGVKGERVSFLGLPSQTTSRCGLDHRSFFSHGSGGWKSKMEASVRRIGFFRGLSLLGLRLAAFSVLACSLLSMCLPVSNVLF